MTLQAPTLIAAMTALILGGVEVHAQTPSAATVKLEIDSQPLTDALNLWASQTGYMVLIDVGGRGQQLKSPRVSGDFTPEAALKMILDSSGLQYEFVTPRTVAIRSKSSAEPAARTGAANSAETIRLAAAETRASESEGAQPSRPAAEPTVEGIHTVIVRGTTIDDPILSSRTGDTLRERPQSVSIVTRQRMDEQNIDSLTSALEQTTGITVVKESVTSAQFYSRGFEINSVQVDGGAALVVNAGGYDQAIDLALYEQVEVLRGSEALFVGNGKPGGTVQLVRKRPTATGQVGVEASGGSWDRFRAHVDVSGPAAFDGRVRGRALYMSESNKSFQRDLRRGERDLLYGIIEGDVADGTLLSVGGSYTRSLAPLGSFGLPRYRDGRDLELPRSASLTADWSRTQSEVGEVFVSLEQRLGERWSLRANAMRREQDSDFLFYYQFAAIDPIDPVGSLYAENGERHSVQEVADVTLKGSFDAWGMTHKVAIGADWQERLTTGPAWDAATLSFDPFNFDASAIPMPGRTAVPSSTRNFGNEQSGAYVSLNLQLMQRLHLLGGARYSNYEFESAFQYAQTPQFNSATRYRDRDIITPQLGLTFDLPGRWVSYASYSEIFESQANRQSGPFPGGPLDPMTGETLELGVKGEMGSGRAATQFAVYQITRRDEAVLDPSFPPQNGALGATCCYLAQGVVESRGFDAEVSGLITDRWDFFAGYTYNENELKSGFASNLGTSFWPRTPKHLFKLWSGFRFDGAWSRLKLSGGVNAQSENFVQGTVTTFNEQGQATGSAPYRFSQGSYAVVGLRAEYVVSEVWSLALNVDNLLDETYYQTIGNTSSRNWYGQPRNYMLTIRGKW